MAYLKTFVLPLSFLLWSLCVQDLLEVLPKEDAGAVRGRSHELSAAVSGSGPAGRSGGCGQQSL